MNRQELLDTLNGVKKGTIKGRITVNDNPRKGSHDAFTMDFEYKSKEVTEVKERLYKSNWVDFELYDPGRMVAIQLMLWNYLGNLCRFMNRHVDNVDELRKLEEKELLELRKLGLDRIIRGAEIEPERAMGVRVDRMRRM